MHRGVFLFVAAGAVLCAGEGSGEDPGYEYRWNKVVYLGGVPGVRVDRRDLEQTLTVSPTSLIVTVQPPPDTNRSPGRAKIAPKVLFEIPRESIIAITYGGFRHDMPSAQAWIGIRGYWPKATDHLIVFSYRLHDGGKAEVLLRVDKKYFQEILNVLRNKARDSGPNS